MKVLGPALLAIATMVSALAIAIIRDSYHLADYRWAVPYLLAFIVGSIGAAVISFFLASHKASKDKPIAPIQANMQIVQAKPSINVDLSFVPTGSPLVLRNAEHEAQIQEMMRRFRRHYNEAEARHPGKFYKPIIKPSPDDDIEVFMEAMRRIKVEYGR
jgi:hypothetical protein